MQLAEATKLNGVVTTSSPASTPAARIARWSPAVPEETADTCSDTQPGAEAGLELAQPRAEREPAGAERLEH